MKHCGGTYYAFSSDGMVDSNSGFSGELKMKSDAVSAHIHASLSSELTNQTLREALDLKPLLGAMATPAPLWRRVYTRWCRHLLL